MASWIVALLFAASIGTWIYTKMARQAGYGNSRNAYIGAGLAAATIFIVLLSVLKLVGL